MTGHEGIERPPVKIQRPRSSQKDGDDSDDDLDGRERRRRKEKWAGMRKKYFGWILVKGRKKPVRGGKASPKAGEDGSGEEEGDDDEAEDYFGALTRYLEKHNPRKATKANVKKILKQHKGKEDELLEKVGAKYGEAVLPRRAARSAAAEAPGRASVEAPDAPPPSDPSSQKYEAIDEIRVEDDYDFHDEDKVSEYYAKKGRELLYKDRAPPKESRRRHETTEERAKRKDHERKERAERKAARDADRAARDARRAAETKEERRARRERKKEHVPRRPLGPPPPPHT